MTTWNYRVFSQTTGGEQFLTMREVYYDDAGKPTNYTKRGVGPHGEDLEEMRRSHEKMAKAFDLPVLTDADFPLG
jgi:hypothetical protein